MTALKRLHILHFGVVIVLDSLESLCYIKLCSLRDNVSLTPDARYIIVHDQMLYICLNNLYSYKEDTTGYMTTLTRKERVKQRAATKRRVCYIRFCAFLAFQQPPMVLYKVTK